MLVIAFFQIAVLQQPFPNLADVALGLVCVIAGLALFIQGLESGLFPLGEALAQGFARKGRPPRCWLSPSAWGSEPRSPSRR